MFGAFKTPTLRGVAHGGPFGHGGAARSLFTIAETYCA
jgi:cytochrome c peroxidase